MKRNIWAIAVSCICFVLFITGCSQVNKGGEKTELSSPSATTSTKTFSFSPSDLKADYIVEPSLDYGEYMPFSNGFAVVSNKKELEQERYAFIDKNGKLLGDGFIYRGTMGFKEDGLAVVQYEDETYAFIDKTGKKILDNFGGKKFFKENGIPHDFINGLSVVSVHKDNNWVSAVINTKGDIVIPFDFTNKYEYQPFYDGVSIRKAPGKSDAVVDTTGKVLFALNNDEKFTSNYFTDGAAFYTVTSGKDPLYGIVDKSGNKITDPVYNWHGGFNKGLAYTVYSNTSKGNAFIDTMGNVKFTIPDISDAKVYDSVIVAKGNNGLQYIYDLKGKKLCDRGFTQITGVSENGIISFIEDDNSSLIDSKGNSILQTKKYDYSELQCHENLVIVIQNGKMGIMEIMNR